MLNILKNTETKKMLEKIDNIEKGSWIDLQKPTESEIKRVVEETGVDEILLKSALDEEETSHIDTDDNQLLVSINMPITEKNNKGKYYTTMPIGILIVNDDYIITISSGKINLVDMLSKKKKIVGEIATYKKSRLAFQLLYITAVEFLKYLTYMSNDLEAFEDNLTKSMSNNELLKLINYQKSMIFLNTALKTNQSVIERLKRGKLIKLYEEDQDILEDAAIENRQAIEMATIYGEILNGMTDIYGTVVSNNLNNVMKLLTSITVILSIPTLIASILGMNVIFPFDTGVSGFYIAMAITIIITISVAVWLNKKDMLK
ncbi:MAG: magnesium transporter CorA family protein [Clostridia bacterium]|nr:magnesium transporter CorA family protein [Clostridia bacterium]